MIADVRGPLTISLIVEGDELDAVQPEAEGVGVGRVDARGGRVGAQQLALCVSNQFSRVATTQTLGGILVHRRNVVALGSADDGAQ